MWLYVVVGIIDGESAKMPMQARGYISLFLLDVLVGGSKVKSLCSVYQRLLVRDSG